MKFLSINPLLAERWRAFQFLSLSAAPTTVSAKRKSYQRKIWLKNVFGRCYKLPEHVYPQPAANLLLALRD